MRVHVRVSFLSSNPLTNLYSHDESMFNGRDRRSSVFRTDRFFLGASSRNEGDERWYTVSTVNSKVTLHLYDRTTAIKSSPLFCFVSNKKKCSNEHNFMKPSESLTSVKTQRQTQKQQQTLHGSILRMGSVKIPPNGGL